MLDFTQITTQIRDFSADNASRLPARQTALAEARQRLRNSGADWNAIQEKIAASRTSWLLADWLEMPDAAVPLPPRPLPYVALAADGSQIVADRHDIALCYLLNVGLIALRYGDDARAKLSSQPLLAPPDEELLEEREGEQAAIAPRRLAIRRQLKEIAGLIALMEETGEAIPALALYDGTLILWTLESEQEEFRARALQEFQNHLETARQKRIPLAGYISQSSSRDVINALRIPACPHPRANCDRFCPSRSKPKPLFAAPDCAYSERVLDRELFAQILEPGQRSAVFGSRSQILASCAPPHHIRFFYLHTGVEVARIEIPDWVASDPELLDRTHALCMDQARKGGGYPVALAEAHEQATVRGAERDAFFRLMEREFVRARQPVCTTQKTLSKRARRI